MRYIVEVPAMLAVSVVALDEEKAIEKILHYLDSRCMEDPRDHNKQQFTLSMDGDNAELGVDVNIVTQYVDVDNAECFIADVDNGEEEAL